MDQHMDVDVAEIGVRPATLPEMMRTLAELRKDAEGLEMQASIANQVAMATPQWRTFETLRDQLGETRAQVEALEHAIRREAVAAYEQDCVRRPAEGVEVKLFSKLHYNPGVAELWCRRECPQALAFDAKKFEKIAQELGGPVTPMQEPRAMIARDLSHWLR